MRSHFSDSLSAKLRVAIARASNILNRFGGLPARHAHLHAASAGDISPQNPLPNTRASSQLAAISTSTRLLFTPCVAHVQSPVDGPPPQISFEFIAIDFLDWERLLVPVRVCSTVPTFTSDLRRCIEGTIQARSTSYEIPTPGLHQFPLNVCVVGRNFHVMQLVHFDEGHGFFRAMLSNTRENPEVTSRCSSAEGRQCHLAVLAEILDACQDYLQVG